MKRKRQPVQLEYVLRPSPMPPVHDAVLLRDPQPTDVLMLSVDPRCSPEEAHHLRDALQALVPCKVVVVGGAQVVTIAPGTAFHDTQPPEPHHDTPETAERPTA